MKPSECLRKCAERVEAGEWLQDNINGKYEENGKFCMIGLVKNTYSDDRFSEVDSLALAALAVVIRDDEGRYGPLISNAGVVTDYSDSNGLYDCNGKEVLREPSEIANTFRKAAKFAESQGD